MFLIVNKKIIVNIVERIEKNFRKLKLIPKKF